jgi:hypothetical protein
MAVIRWKVQVLAVLAERPLQDCQLHEKNQKFRAQSQTNSKSNGLCGPRVGLMRIYAHLYNALTSTYAFENNNAR